jgi:MoaD family protein
LPGQLRDCCGGVTELELPVACESVQGLLDELLRRHPALHRSVCDETGAVRRHVNLFVNADHVRDRAGLGTPLVAGDVLSIYPAVSGG